MKNLEPRAVWSIFDEITRVPRPSKREGRIVEWLVDFAVAHGLTYRRDAIGNVVILAPATRGMEDRPAVILQNHVDMVCECNSGLGFDFDRDPIETYVTPDGWVRARGTTLGADNGVGMAMALALLIDPAAPHPALEALFTVDEETGLTGAFGLGTDMISGSYLINLDSEDEGEVFIGCAGGVDTLAFFDYVLEPAPEGCRFFEIAVSGLLGGHSGDDIEKGRGNSNRILSRAISGWLSEGLRLATIDGGNVRNAIPREARAVVAVPEECEAEFVAWVERFDADVRAELAHSDSGVSVSLVEASAVDEVIDAQTVRRLMLALLGVPNGPQAMSFAMPGLVETSTNLASVKMVDGQIVVTTSQRSSVESAKWAAAEAVEAVFALAGARVEHSDGYPGWAPDPSSRLLELAEKAYLKLFDRPVKVRAIHAGLECGLFLEKYPHLEMISTGPTILGAHSPDERIEIATVDRAWRLLLEVVRTI
ncbi:MAG: aminoacyl-histidine dipeptidase [Alistipes sp.]|jgi:dipeptidase D|nr:aminoacyl-histidine dipeptidase [Alistipes sp.]